MLEGAAIFESVAIGNLTSKYGEVKSICITQPDAYGEHKGYYTLTVNESNNYKEEDMNKTVRDAVMWLKGEIPAIDTDGHNIYLYDVIIYCHTKGKQAIKGEFNFGTGNYKKDVYCYVCSQPEFNTYVDSLSHHAGKELFQQYLAADKKECEDIATPADLLDENSRQSKVARIGDLLHNMSCSMDDENEQNEFGGYASYLWDLADYFRNSSSSSEAQPKPAFTQEMCDNGELPSVGMECMILFDNDSEPEWHEITWYGLFNGNPSFLCKGKQCWPERGGEFHIKPLTTPLSAEDQALDDMVEQLTNEGISAYDPIMLRILIEKFKNNKISGVSFKPLTVDKS